MPCVLAFLLLALFLWTMTVLVIRRALRGRKDAAFQKGLQDLLEDQPAPHVGRRASPWLWVAAAALALLAFGVSLCTGAFLLSPYRSF